MLTDNSQVGGSHVAAGSRRIPPPRSCSRCPRRHTGLHQDRPGLSPDAGPAEPETIKPSFAEPEHNKQETEQSAAVSSLFLHNIKLSSVKRISAPKTTTFGVTQV